MNSFLKGKQVQFIVVLVIAIAVWAMFVGLGLRTGTARAASPARSNYTIATKKVHHFDKTGLVQGTAYFTCPAGMVVDVAIQYSQGSISAGAGNTNVTCSGHLQYLVMHIGVFTKGSATFTGTLTNPNTLEVLAMTTQTVKIV